MRRLFMGEVSRQALQARYYLLEEDGEGPRTYGVQIELGEEEASVPDLSPCRERVLALAEALARGAVTPVALRDVVDDWLAE